MVITAQVLLLIVFLVLFLWRAGGAKSSVLVLLLIAFVLFALFFATDLGQWMLNGLENIMNALRGGEVVDPQPERGM